MLTWLPGILNYGTAPEIITNTDNNPHQHLARLHVNLYLSHPMNELLKARNLTRRYAGCYAVSDVSITLNSGDILGLLGPNGAGKTTTMGMLTGNLAPSSGSVMIKGIDLLDHPKQAKQHTGYLPEQPPVYRDQTVNEYLRYCARLHNIHGKQINAAVDRARERTGLADTGKRIIGNLSRGYQQRVGIAQAIIHEPEVIILDEPTVGLDPIQIREIRELIRELGTQHGVILSTHILPEVQAVCNRIHILYEGRIAYDDDAARSTDSGAQLVVCFQSTANTQMLNAINGITKIEENTVNRFTVTYSSETNPAIDIANLAANQQWGLLELTPVAPGLEQVFLNLTSGNQPVEKSHNDAVSTSGEIAT